MAQRPRRAPGPEPSADSTVPRTLPEPIGSVRRELVRPDGKKIVVDVPVYPPFSLEAAEKTPPKPATRRLRSGPRPNRTGSE